MLASMDKRGVNLSEILRADGYAFDGSEDAIARLALAPEAVQGCVLWSHAGDMEGRRRVCATRPCLHGTGHKDSLVGMSLRSSRSVI